MRSNIKYNKVFYVFSAPLVLGINGPIEIKSDNKVGEIQNYFQNYEVSFELNVKGELTWDMQRSITGLLKTD